MPDEVLSEVILKDRVILRKKVTWFKEGSNVRKDRPPEYLESLSASLKKGQLHPVLARSCGTVIDGWGRVLAAKQEGIEYLDVIITAEDLTPSQIHIIQFSSSQHRKDLSDGEKWRAACEILQARPDWKNKELGEALSLDAPTVSKLLSPCRCIGSVQDALTAGVISLSVAYEISKFAPDEQQRAFEARLSGATRDEIGAIRKKSRNSNGEAKVVSRIKLEFPTGTTVAVSGPAMSLEELSSVLADALKAVKRGIAEGHDAKTLQAVLGRKAKTSGR